MGYWCQGACVTRWAHLVWGSLYAKLMLEGLNLLSNTELRCDPGGTQCLGVDLSGAGGVVGYFCLVGFGVYFCCLFL